MTNILQDYSTEKLLDQIDNDEIDMDSENYVDTKWRRTFKINSGIRGNRST